MLRKWVYGRDCDVSTSSSNTSIRVFAEAAAAGVAARTNISPRVRARPPPRPHFAPLVRLVGRSVGLVRLVRSVGSFVYDCLFTEYPVHN